MTARRPTPEPDSEEEVVELLHYDPDDSADEEEDFADELPAGDPSVEGNADSTEEREGDDFGGEAPVTLPQPDRARSAPDLPKVKSSAFKRLLR